MTIGDAISFLWLRGFSLTIRMRSARVYLRGKWRVSVRARQLESLEKMIIRLAEKAQLQESFVLPPEPKPKPGRRTKAHLKQIREQLHVN